MIIEERLSLPADLAVAAVEDTDRGVPGDAGVAMLLVVPADQFPGPLSGLLQRGKLLGIAGVVLRGLEPGF